VAEAAARLAKGEEEAPLAETAGETSGVGGDSRGEGEAGSDMVAAPPLGLVAVGVSLTVAGLAVAVDVPVGTDVDEALTSGGSEVVGVVVLEGDADGTPDADAETPSVSVLVADCVPEGVAEALTEGAAVLDGEAPRDREELAVCEVEELIVGRTVSVADVEAEAPGASERVGVSVAVAGADCVSEADADQVLLALPEGEGVAPRDSVAVADCVCVCDCVCVPVPLSVPLPEEERVPEALPVCVGVPEGVEPGDSVCVVVPDGEGEKDVDGVWLGVKGTQANTMTAPAPPAPVALLKPPTYATPPSCTAEGAR